VSCGDAGTATAVAGRLKGEKLGLRDPNDESKWLDLNHCLAGKNSHAMAVIACSEIMAIMKADNSLTQAQALEGLKATNPEQAKLFVGRLNSGHAVIPGAVYTIYTYTCLLCGEEKESTATSTNCGNVKISCACKPDSEGKPSRHRGWIAFGDDSDAHRSRNAARLIRKEAVAILREWCNEHTAYPFPCLKEKQQLCSKSGMTLESLCGWFKTFRRSGGVGGGGAAKAAGKNCTL